MRKFLLISAFAALGFFSNAQTTVGRDRNLQFMHLEHPMVSSQGVTHHATNNSSRSQRATGSHLNSQRLGTSGNLFTIIEGNCKMVDANNTLNSVTFIHRCDNIAFPTNDIGQYRYDFSRDGGLTFTNNLGPITNNPLLSDDLHNGRYPQGIIYNPTGNNIVDSAKFIYDGTWHNSPAAGGSGSWQGDLRGRGQLGNNGSTFDTHLDQLNGGATAIATGLCTGAPGVFWNVNQDFTGTFATGSNQLIVGIIPEKGVWNNVTRTVDWTAMPEIQQTFVTYTNSGSTTAQSAATSFTIAFDPTGQYGWIGCLADTGSTGLGVYQPVLWGSNDFGATWTGPYVADLASIPKVMQNLGTMVAQYAQSPSIPLSAASGIPTTTFEEALTVDINGIPHMITSVGNQIPANPYTIDDAGYDFYDFTFNPNATSIGCAWQVVHLAKTGTFAGVFSSDASPNETVQEHRPQTSRSDDGSKLFFFWNCSDVAFTEANATTEDNLAPNLFGVGLDVVSGKMTPVYNFTAGDSLWGGQTNDSAQGVFGGAIMPTIGAHCLSSGGNYNVPLVMAQIDYATAHSYQGGSNLVPAAYWYINNINFASSAFTINSNATAPVVTLNGADTISILSGTVFADPGATAFDCVDGNLNVQTIGTVDTAAGIYTLLYVATDLAGNSDTAIRTVIVGGVPVASFTWTFTNLQYVAHFTDASSNFPTAWQWRFTSPSAVTTGTTTQNPTWSLNEDGVWNVCLTASNNFGTSPQVCHSVSATGVGINEVSFAESVTVFPNPTNGKATIAIAGNTSSDFTVSVTNMLGETVRTAAKYKVGTTHVDMDLTGLASGVYLVKLQSNDASVVKHLTVTQK